MDKPFDFYKDIVENSADGILVLDHEGIILYCNPAARQFFKSSKQPPEGQLFGFPVVTKEFTELEMVSAQGEVVAFEMRVAQTPWLGKQAYIASLRDITRRKKSEDALKEVRMQWEMTFNAIEDTITIMDLNKHIVRTNESIKTLVHRPPAAMIGWSCRDLFDCMETACRQCPVDKTIADKAHHSGEISVSLTGKTYRINTFPMIDKIGQLEGVVHVTKDITEHKNLSRQLRQAQKMEAIGTLAGGIAHDFNNILAIIMGYTDMAITRAENMPELKDDLTEVYKAGRRAAELVRQMLTFSRKSEARLKPLKIRLVIAEALKMLRATLPSTIEITDALKRHLPYVMADATQIYQVIMNLCTNAAHAMEPDGGTIFVGLNLANVTPGTALKLHGLTPGPHLLLKVCDTGCGIPEERMESIFDPYFTTKKSGDGTGLGLSVVHGIVKLYGGAITVESKVGKGTCFYIYFKTIPQTAPEKEVKPDPQTLQGHGKILVVDDEPSITRLIDKILSPLGYETVLENNSSKALELFKQEPFAFDLVLTDMTMPHLTGDRLAQKIADIRPDCPVILMTGFSDEIMEDQKRPPHVTDLIMKPLCTTKLTRIISSLIQKPKG